jgi:hypothetical protein
MLGVIKTTRHTEIVGGEIVWITTIYQSETLMRIQDKQNRTCYDCGFIGCQCIEEVIE